MQQLALDIAAEHFSKREKLIIKRLGEYRTIDADIAHQERLSRGIGLRHQPSVTVAPPSEDDPRVLEMLKEPLSDSQAEIAATIAKYVTPDKFRYAASYRVANALAHTYSDDKDEDYRIRDAVDILRRRYGEEYIHLTDTERLAILREEEMAEARRQLQILRERKDIISFALEQMEKWYHEEYLILWHKYVMNEHWKKVCEIAARNGLALTEDEYRLSRKKALKHFDRWAYGLR